MGGEGERIETAALHSPCQGFASAIGFALGDLLILHGQPDSLGECLRCIQITAHAAILSADLKAGRRLPRGERTALYDAALAVVRAWREEATDRSVLGNAIVHLQEALEAEGARYATEDFGSE